MSILFPDDPDAIVDRALKLAGIYSRTRENRHRSNSLSSLTNGAVSPGGYFWRRPTSAASSTGMLRVAFYFPNYLFFAILIVLILRSHYMVFSYPH